MGGTDKLLARIGGRPLLAHTLAAMLAAPDVASIVVVTSAERRRELEAGPWLPDGDAVTFVEGGERRQDSVRSGFDALERTAPDADGERVVLVHDGARPAVSTALIAAVVEAASAHGAAIPVVPVSETLKRIDGERITATVDRSGLAAAQTPQGVRRGILRTALASDEASQGTWTDEAALLEACRIPVHVVPGDPANLKVTVPADLARAATLIAGPDPARRTGIGHDAHPFGPGEPLRLGGVDIPGAPRLHGHSDGDVVLHARRRCVAGCRRARATSAGCSRPMPRRPPASTAAHCCRTWSRDSRTAAGGAAGVDLTIVAARPRLGGHLEAIRASIAGDLGLAPEAVNVKASTGNLDGSEGAGRSISTLALATIEAADMSEVRLQDTLTGEKRPLVPLRDDGIGVYSCGPTVYGPAHIGNFRSFLFADLLVRHLRWRGHTVRWVMNITDVDDKIIRGAAAAGIGIDELANRYLEGFLADADALRMTRPDVLPRATEHIDEMVALIGTLLEREHAYRTDDGSIFFRIASWPTYGRLARLDPEQLRVGERVEADEYAKDDVRDFALWKGAKPGEPSWNDGHRRRSARLAHRMLRHEHGPPRDVVRYPHGWHRPDLPAPRGRDRPERSRDRPAVRQHLAALRAPAVERHEDGQVDGEHRPAERAVRGGRVATGSALRTARRALPGRPQPLGRIAGRGGGGLVTPGRPRRGAGGLPRGSVGRRDAARRCWPTLGRRSVPPSMTTSTSRRRWPRPSTCCAT